jgi:hypothetical protein
MEEDFYYSPFQQLPHCAPPSFRLSPDASKVTADLGRPVVELGVDGRSWRLAAELDGLEVDLKGAGRRRSSKA